MIHKSCNPEYMHKSQCLCCAQHECLHCRKATPDMHGGMIPHDSPSVVDLSADKRLCICASLYGSTSAQCVELFMPASCLLDLEAPTCLIVAQALFMLYRRKQHLHCPHDDWGCVGNCGVLPVFTLQNCYPEKTCSAHHKGCARFGRSRSWIQARHQSVS